SPPQHGLPDLSDGDGEGPAVAGRRGVPAGPRGVHEHGWPPGPPGPARPAPRPSARTWPGRYRRWGALLENYYAIGHSSAANYVAQVSGQGPRAASTRRRSRRSATSCQPPGAAGRRTCRTWATTRPGTTPPARRAGPPAAIPPPG